MPPNVHANRRYIGNWKSVLVAVGDLDRDPMAKLVAQPSEPTRPNWLNQHVEVICSDEDCLSPFAQVAPENPIRFGGLLPGDESSAIRIAGIGLAGSGVDEGRQGSFLGRRSHVLMITLA